MKRPTHILPLEIIENIIDYLPIQDRLSCILTCKVWYSQLYQSMIRVVFITYRRQLVSFLQHLEKYEQVGLQIREIHLNSPLNMRHDEFNLIGVHCPLLEVFKFSNWENYQGFGFSKFKKIKQIPKLFDEKKGRNVIKEVGNSLTHLQISAYLLARLIPTNNHFALLRSTNNLTHLTLEGVYHPNPIENDPRCMVFDYIDWDLIHEYCPNLVYINMSNAILKATEEEAKLMAIKSRMKPRVKELILKSVRIENTAWIYCIGFNYPNLELLEMDFDIGTFVSFDETINKLDQIECQTGFLLLAYKFKKLKKLSFKGLKKSHFPGKLFFDLLTTRKISLQDITILYDTNTFRTTNEDNNNGGMNLDLLNSLTNGQKSTLKSLNIDMWFNVYYEENFYSFIEPISLCKKLNRLSIHNDDYTTFNYNTIPIDLILDSCLELIELSLVRISVSIATKSMKRNQQHSLKQLNLSLSRISQEIFDYLSKKCININYMSLINCIWTPREIEMKINMPNNSFNYLCILGMNGRKIVGLEGNLVTGNTVNLLSINQLDKNELKRKRYQKNNLIPPKDFTRWYHLYKPTISEFTDDYYFPPASIRKLRKIEVIQIMYLTEYCKQNQHLTKIRPSRDYEFRYVSKRLWKSDITSGYISITCKSIQTLKYDFNVISFK